MSSKDNLEGAGKTNNKCSTITRDDEYTSESQKVENRFADPSESKEDVYTSKKITANWSKQSSKEQHKKHVHPSAEDKQQSSTSNKAHQSNLHVRYWTYLFDNLHRSIDEIFCACESEENVSGCHVREIKYFIISSTPFPGLQYY